MNSSDRFLIYLENEKAVTYRKLGLALTIFHFITFLFFLFQSTVRWAGSVGIAVILIYLAIRKLRNPTKKLYYLVDGKLFYLLAIVWLPQNIFICLFVVLTGLLLNFSSQQFRFVFSVEGIKKDFFPRRKYEWAQMDTVILKDGILTLDFKNNHLIQLAILNSEQIDTAAFNAFASDRLRKV